MSDGQVAAVWRKSGRNWSKCEPESDAKKQTKINNSVPCQVEVKKGQTGIQSAASNTGENKTAALSNELKNVPKAKIVWKGSAFTSDTKTLLKPNVTLSLVPINNFIQQKHKEMQQFKNETSLML